MPLPNEIRGVVFNIMRFAVHDGPGIRTTVFFKGCPLRCWWCHNPESQRPELQLIYYDDRCRHCGECVTACPQHAIAKDDLGQIVTSDACTACGTCTDTCVAGAREIAGKWMAVSEVIAEVERDSVFFDESGGGVTLSGGEPLMQPEFAEAIVDACKERRIKVAIDTCGLAPKALIERLAAKVDTWLYDLKMMSPQRHAKYTGVGNDTVLQNLELLARVGRDVTVRMPLVPGVNDDETNLTETSAFLSEVELRRITLLPYHTTGVEKYRRLRSNYMLMQVEPPTTEHVGNIRARLEVNGFEVKVGG